MRVILASSSITRRKIMDELNIKYVIILYPYKNVVCLFFSLSTIKKERKIIRYRC